MTTETGALTDEGDGFWFNGRCNCDSEGGRFGAHRAECPTLAARAGGQQTQAEAALDAVVEELSKPQSMTEFFSTSPYLWAMGCVSKVRAALPERAPTQAEQAVERVRALAERGARKGYDIDPHDVLDAIEGDG